MSIPTPTYYGPVPAGQVHSSQTENSLSCMVLQSCDDYGSYDSRDYPSFAEKWKGPTSEMLSNDTSGFKVFGVSFVPGMARPAIPSTWVRRFDPPALGAGWVWKIDSIQVQNLEAGDHSMMTVKYSAALSSSIPTQDKGKLDKRKTEWSLSWRTRNSTALIYLAEKGGTLKGIRWLDPSRSDQSVQDKHVDDLSIYAKMAIDATKTESSQKKIKLEKYQFIMDGAVYEIPDESDMYNEDNQVNPQEVIDKCLAGICPLIHYPIVTKKTAANFDRSGTSFPKWTTIDPVVDRGDGVGEYLDCIVDYPDDCPFEFEEDDFVWLKTDDSFATSLQQSTLTYTRTEQWTGDWSWDEKFYSEEAPWYTAGRVRARQAAAEVEVETP